MSRDSRLKPLVETACGLDGEATKATVSATRKIAQPIDLQPSHPNNCSDCGKGKTRNKGGRFYEMHRKPPADFAEFVASNANVSQMRKHWQCTWSTIARWFDETGTPRRTKGASARPVPEDFTSLAPAMFQKDLSAHYGAHESVVRRWFQITGLRPKQYHPSPAEIQRQRIPVHRINYSGPHQVKASDQRDTSLEGLAAEHLRCATRAVVYRCTDKGRADPKGRFWRYGNVVLTPVELFVRAHRHDFEARRFAA